MQGRAYDLLVIGELNVDILVTGDTVPEFGQVEKLVQGITVTGGGSAAIMAAAASRLGMRVLYASIVGDDPFGHLLLETMHAAGVDVSHIVVDPRVATGATIHLLREDGDRAMLTYPGSMAHITEALVDPAWFDQVRHLHLASPFILTGLAPAMPRFAAQAHRHGVTVSLDTNWDPAERWDVGNVLDETDLLLPNEAEACALAPSSEPQLAMDILSQRVPVLAVKQGERGATGAQGRDRVYVPAFVVSALDTTGAGDVFDAGFLAAWLRGATLKQALVVGSAAAALSTRALGGFAAQPDWSSVLDLIASQAPEAFTGIAELPTTMQ